MQVPVTSRQTPQTPILSSPSSMGPTTFSSGHVSCRRQDSFKTYVEVLVIAQTNDIGKIGHLVAFVIDFNRLKDISHYAKVNLWDYYRDIRTYAEVRTFSNAGDRA